MEMRVIELERYNTKESQQKQKTERLGQEKYNNQNCLMKIIEYNGARNIIVEFQDTYKARVHTTYNNFQKSNVKNPYHPSVCGVGMIGTKYPSAINHKNTREYTIWFNMIHRCFNKEYMKKYPTYQNVTCCDEWLLFENFYEWLHSQENFDKWGNGENWGLDKDILIKGNKTYSPDACCLVPMNVNILFIKRDAKRGDFPIGVSWNKSGGFQAECKNHLTGKSEYLGWRLIPEQSFELYKSYKENMIKKVAEIEYDKGNITKQCYESMIKYEVEIDD